MLLGTHNQNIKNVLHLNLTGATKLSKYFADILKTNYELTDYRGDAIYEKKLEEYKQAIQ